MLPDAIDRLCDSLTVALCSVEALGYESLNTTREIHLGRAEEATKQSGELVWEINALREKKLARIQTLLALQG